MNTQDRTIAYLLGRIEQLERELKEERERTNKVKINFTPIEPNKWIIEDSFDFIAWVESVGFKKAGEKWELKDSKKSDCFVLTINKENAMFDIYNRSRLRNDRLHEIRQNKIPTSQQQAINVLGSYGVPILE